VSASNNFITQLLDNTANKICLIAAVAELIAAGVAMYPTETESYSRFARSDTRFMSL
jgi:hypothetical protein